MNLEKFKSAIKAGNVKWRKHVLIRISERRLSQSNVLKVLQEGDIIEDYATNQPFPNALFLGFPEGKPLHVVASFDEKNNNVYIITAYKPLKKFFSEDYRKRKRL